LNNCNSYLYLRLKDYEKDIYMQSGKFHQLNLLKSMGFYHQ